MVAAVVPRSRPRSSCSATALELPSRPEDSPVSTIQTIIDTLPDEEWFAQVRNWRNPEFGAPDSWYWYLDGNGWTPQRAWIPGRVERAKAPLRAYPIAPERAAAPGSRAQREPRTVAARRGAMVG